MGFSDWSDAAYQSRQNHRRATKQTAFTYDKQVNTTGVVQVHPQMNPFGAMRESRDSDVHPESVAIGVVFDVTGSMGTVPKVLQTKLGALMRVLIQKGYLEHPQVLFGAVGDAFCDRVPLQIGQFEAGLEMDDDLGKIYLEGGGGGQVHESYELAMYFFARHTLIDCFEKRGHKGYLFTIGDEKPYPAVKSQQVREHIGDELVRDLPVAKVIAELQQRYEYFHIIPTNTSHGRNAAVQGEWKKLLGERVLLLEDEGAVCETVALAVGLCEGTIYDLDSGVDDLIQAGHDTGATTAAATALMPYAAVRVTQPRPATGLLPARAGTTLDDGRF
ncbi:MAG TPA: hypothetical protein VFS21_08730 [Roseiflexaceae bacterium]|nr:hypothetical protein [Roseiflexaceae bacterium]